MSVHIDKIANAYKTLAKIPSIVSGKLNSTGNRITSKWSVRNLDKGKTSKYLYSYILDKNLNVVTESEFGTDVSNELLSATSPRDTFRAVIREEKEKEVKKQYLEVWSRNTLAHCIDLTALDLHGDVYADSEFGSLDWTYDESALVYIAEKKLKKSEPYIKRKAADKTDDGSGEKAPIKGEEYVYKQDWGEQLVGKHLSVIVVCRLQDESVTVLEGLPPSWCPGQVRFSPDGQSVVGVAWETEPRRLGLIFCTNRPGYIFSLTLDGQMKKLSNEGKSVRSVRWSPSGKCVWLQRNADGPHHACHAIVSHDMQTNETSTLIDIVETKISTSEGGDFHGCYNLALPGRCFSGDGKRLLFSTPQKNEVRTYVLNIETGAISDISIKTAPGSTSILDVRNDVILATYSNMTTPGQLLVAQLAAQGVESAIEWKRVSSPQPVPPSVSSSAVQYLHLEHDNDDSVKSFSALYFAPSATEGKLPLIVWPHGGPHSGFVNAYSLEAALFNILGFASLQINYRGSTGAGQASVDYLPKRVGDADVKDCKLATDITIRNNPIDEKKLCLFGGSHGGFLVTHLSGQYPDTYQVVVTRNPVTDVATMLGVTDIADWCAVEAGFAFSEKGPLSEQQLLALRRCSPLAHVHRVKAPTALMLGAGDKRVPHYQGLDYSRRLKANGVETRIYMYDDNHSLSSFVVEMDNLINSADWFLQHLD